MGQITINVDNEKYKIYTEETRKEYLERYNRWLKEQHQTEVVKKERLRVLTELKTL